MRVYIIKRLKYTKVCINIIAYKINTIIMLHPYLSSNTTKLTIMYTMFTCVNMRKYRSNYIYVYDV